MTELDWPDTATATDLYRRLLTSDRVASSEFAAAFLEPLIAYLHAAYPHADDHHRIEAAEDAVLSVIRNPAVYDPSRGNLLTFLRMAARRDLDNIRAREQRHQRNREIRDCVELGTQDGNGFQDADLPSFDDPGIAAIVATLSEDERRVLDLMRTGERRTEAFAALLGVANRSVDEQRRVVKQVKDRVKKRFQRTEKES